MRFKRILLLIGFFSEVFCQERHTIDGKEYYKDENGQWFEIVDLLPSSTSNLLPTSSEFPVETNTASAEIPELNLPEVLARANEAGSSGTLTSNATNDSKIGSETKETPKETKKETSVGSAKSLIAILGVTLVAVLAAIGAVLFLGNKKIRKNLHLLMTRKKENQFIPPQSKGQSDDFQVRVPQVHAPPVPQKDTPLPQSQSSSYPFIRASTATKSPVKLSPMVTPKKSPTNSPAKHAKQFMPGSTKQQPEQNTLTSPLTSYLKRYSISKTPRQSTVFPKSYLMSQMNYYSDSVVIEFPETASTDSDKWSLNEPRSLEPRKEITEAQLLVPIKIKRSSSLPRMSVSVSKEKSVSTCLSDTDIQEIDDTRDFFDYLKHATMYTVKE